MAVYFSVRPSVSISTAFGGTSVSGCLLLRRAHPFGVLTLVGVGQLLERRHDVGVLGPCRRQLGGHVDVPRSIVAIDADIDFVADLDAEVGARCLAQSDHVLAAHDGEAQPGRPIGDGDAYRSALAAADGVDLVVREHERSSRSERLRDHPFLDHRRDPTNARPPG